MDRSTALDALNLESSRFLVAAAIGEAPLEASVPDCPGWDVAQLVRHLGTIYCRVALVVSTKRTKAPSRDELTPAPDGDARLNWFAEQRTAMLAALEASQADEQVWNWTASSPGPVSFWYRRMAHETVIHRVDAELAHGLEPAQGDPELSADTVAEFFDVFYRHEAGQLAHPDRGVLGGSLHLHAADVPGAEWTLAEGSAGATITRAHSKADVALRGTAFQLARWIWRRLPTGQLEVFGDRSIADRFRENIAV
ncbi:MAG: maleylpyruvate isomerase family mycothiol-dependent enzyme [Acidimicrobiales bacterium]|jgi:uncharacterized protein (TIGR03083 family)